MWNRKELKEKGKAAFRANRIICIIAALLLLLAAGTVEFNSGELIGTATGRMSFEDKLEMDDTYYDDNFDDYSLEDIQDSDSSEEEIYDQIEDSSLPPVFGTSIIIIAICVFVITVLIYTFALNPLRAGVRKFFIDNASDPEAGMNKNNIGIGFGSNYMNVVKAMFTTDLLQFLLTMLFIIPGIIMIYEWRLVPMILSENPDMKGSDARKKSASLMNGSKWKAFVLDLSFIGWHLLGTVSFGIAYILWVNPYIAATEAELYLALKAGENTHKEKEVTFVVTEQ